MAGQNPHCLQSGSSQFQGRRGSQRRGHIFSNRSQSDAGVTSGSQQRSQPNRPYTQTRVFALTQHEAHATPDVVTCILTIFFHKAYILIDLGSTYSFIFHTFVMHAYRQMRSLDCTLIVATLVDNSLLAESIFRDCALRMGNKDMVANLIPLDIYDFDAVLGMNWLANHHAIVGFFLKR